MDKATIYDELRAKLKDIVPDVELGYKAELAARIIELKEQKNAVILGHNYMEAALYHSIPDFRGDSLELCRQAARTDKDIIVFCGVRFMGETAKILNPTKKVLVPSPRAGCSLAESITAEDVRAIKARFPGVPVVTYVNTYADVKAESDICCTSGNAAAVVRSLGTDTVIFLPDEFLARNVAAETGRTIILPKKGAVGAEYLAGAEAAGVKIEMVGWKGRCEVHERFTVEDIANIRRQFPDVKVLAHPECSPEVVKASDFAGSTSQMVRYVREMKNERYLLLTECSMADNIWAENRDKDMLRLCSIRCPHMNEITLEMTLESLMKEQYEVQLDEALRLRALKAVERMIEVG